MSEWISVKKYLPPFHDRVLLLRLDNENISEIVIGYMEHDGQYYYAETKDSIECTDVDRITHWMELPSSPEPPV